MKIISMLCVRDEEDIIQKCLSHRLAWADQIFVFDSGSGDATWEIVCEMSTSESRIVPLRRDAVYFSDTRVRGWLFDQVRSHMRDGDWFSRCDADEIYHVNPRDFIANSISGVESVICHEHFNFVVRDEDLLCEEEMGISPQLKDVENRLRWYWVHGYSEPRLARYRTTMKWSGKSSFPRFAGMVANERIPIRHYPHRSLKQMTKRTLLRKAMLDRGKETGAWNPGLVHHWSRENWRDFVFRDDDPKLLRWHDREELNGFPSFNSDRSRFQRSIYSAFYRWGVRAADLFQKGWNCDDCPEKIDPATQKRLDSIYEWSHQQEL